MTLTVDHAVLGDLIAGIRSFAGDHEGATAAIEYLGGRRGAKIVLTGGDGALAERIVPDTRVARAACLRAGISIEKTWEQELMDQMRPSNDLWRSAGRRVLTR